MKFTVTFIIILFLVSCQSAIKYKSIKNSRKSGYSKNVYKSNDLESSINSWLGVPYKYGGMSKNGVDCSGFVSIIFKNVYEYNLPRTAREQYLKGQKIRMNNISAGDLVFFRGVRGRGIDHVGIFLDSGRFVHASLTNGVIISRLSEDYYSKRFVGACRY